jgi:hypothetical protein
MLKSYCCDCGKVLGQGIKKGEEKKGYGVQEKRRFHATCWKKQEEAYWFHMSYMFNEDKKNYYDKKRHYNFIHISNKKTPTTELTREQQYKEHMEARAFAIKKKYT